MVPERAVRQDDCAGEPQLHGHVATCCVRPHDAAGTAGSRVGVDIGVCMLIASINFCGKRHKLWEGGGAASKYFPSYNLRATGMSLNHFDDIWYAIRWSCQPPEQPDGMLSERYHWMLINDFVTNINKPEDIYPPRPSRGRRDRHPMVWQRGRLC